MSDDDIYHFGVKGMKWGVRKERAKNYSEAQYKRDKVMYGTRGANRINRSMHKGHNVSGARSKEVEKHNRAVRNSTTAGVIGRVAGAAVGAGAGGIGGYFLGSKVVKLAAGAGADYISKNLSPEMGAMVRELATNKQYQVSIKAGIAASGVKIGNTIGARIGRETGRQAPLAIHGYKDRKR